VDLAPFRHRDFRLLFASQIVSLFGTMITYVALPYQMYRLTGSSLAVGLLGVAELVPLLVTAFLGGALADSVDRRRLAVVTEIGLAIGSATLAIVAALPGVASPWILYAVSAAMSACTGLQRPSMESLLPRIVERDDLPAAAGLTAFRGSLGMIAGPAVGGMLLATAGLPAAYGVDVLTYAVSIACLARIRAMPPPEGADRPSLAAVAEGLRYARGREELIGTYVVDFVAMVFGMPLALFPALSDRLGGTRALGLLYAAPALGALVASVTSRWTSRVHRHGLGILWAAGLWGAAIVAFGFAPSLGLSVVFLAVAGGADATSAMFRMTMWNQTIPDALRGRLASIEMVSYMSGPLLGHAEAGAAAAAFGVTASVVSGGALCVVGVVLCAFLLPRFTRYDAREIDPAKIAV
jgi:MFS family permease